VSEVEAQRVDDEQRNTLAALEVFLFLGEELVGVFLADEGRARFDLVDDEVAEVSEVLEISRFGQRGTEPIECRRSWVLLRKPGLRLAGDDEVEDGVVNLPSTVLDVAVEIDDVASVAAPPQVSSSAASVATSIACSQTCVQERRHTSRRGGRVAVSPATRTSRTRRR